MSRSLAQLRNSQDRSYAAIAIHPRNTKDSWQSRLPVVRALWGSKVTGPGLRPWLQRRSLSSPYHGPFQDKDGEYVPSIAILLDAGAQNLGTDLSHWAAKFTACWQNRQLLTLSEPGAKETNPMVNTLQFNTSNRIFRGLQMAGFTRQSRQAYKQRIKHSGKGLHRVTITGGKITNHTRERLHDMGTSTRPKHQTQSQQQVLQTERFQFTIPKSSAVTSLQEKGVCMGNTPTADQPKQGIHVPGRLDTTPEHMATESEHKTLHLPIIYRVYTGPTV